MSFINNFIYFVLHLDKTLGGVIKTYGFGTYVILFTVLFCETGLVVIPFLPGDSLIFAAGAFAAIHSLNIAVLLPLTCAAAVLGDTVNYHIGEFFGPKIFKDNNSKIFKKKYLDKTHSFYEKYGGKTIIIARFIPIVRTFAPFVAGIGSMSYLRFLSYNAIGGIGWASLFTLGGYWFGNFKSVKEHFSIVIIMIIVISILPAVISYIKSRMKK